MSRHASILIDFDATFPGQATEFAIWLRQCAHAFRNVEVTVLDDGAPTLPAATATGPAQQPIPKGPSQ